MSRSRDGVYVEESLLDRVMAATAIAGNHLNRERSAGCAWKGELSSSALSTATAIFALELYSRVCPERQELLHRLVQGGVEWLCCHVNPDGGWGDTVRSPSNLSTTTLVWSALTHLRGRRESGSAGKARERAGEWIAGRAGSTEPGLLARAVIARYGRDRTFSVPILTMAALSGGLGSGRDAWNEVIPLPFELSICPHSWFAALKLPVVSYALPALIAIGQVRHHHAPSGNPVIRWLRNRCVAKSLEVLESIQPSSGGFLEATPLTSFVAMSLIGCGRQELNVTRRCIDFLVNSAREDGSWAIDTDLEVWVTTLSLNAMGMTLWMRPNHAHPQHADRQALLKWLLKAQFQEVHPYTQARPGGWAWTTSPGGVPDADDTAGALIALRHLDPAGEVGLEAALGGVQWLLDLQNRDGGVPTFCRGWGHLPFDRSSPDITAHALRAWAAWGDGCEPVFRRRLIGRMKAAIRFLNKARRADGSWCPLWFGNDRAPNEENLTYGTSRVVVALASLNATIFEGVVPLMESGLEWLLSSQGGDGSWGGARGVQGSMEETAMALEAVALAGVARASHAADLEACAGGVSLGLEVQHQSRVTVDPAVLSAVERGFAWMEKALEGEDWKLPTPIGFYFARLWYFERLYPAIHCLSALTRLRCFAEFFTAPSPMLDLDEELLRKPRRSPGSGDSSVSPSRAD